MVIDRNIINSLGYFQLVFGGFRHALFINGQD